MILNLCFYYFLNTQTQSAVYIQEDLDVCPTIKILCNPFTDETDIGATSRNSGPGVHDGEAEGDEQRHHLPPIGQGQSEASR